MSKVYAISDCHFGHNNILKYRDQFKSIEEHDQTIVDNFNNIITKRDTVYFMGDICFTEEGMENLRKMRWCNKKVLVLGNHDAQFMNSELTKEYYNMFDSVIGSKSWKGAWLTHMPIHPDELRGKLCIHGHTHNQFIDDKRYYNVCLENTDYAPVNLAEVLKKMRGI